MFEPKLFAAFLGLALAAAGAAQDVRYELGLRVRAFETAFEPGCGDVEVRRRVCPSLERAVRAFFAARIDEVARNMDQARHCLAGGPPSDPVHWADSLSLRLSSRLVGVATDALEFELRAVYDVDANRPVDATLHLQLVDEADKPLQDAAQFEIGELPLRAVLPLGVATPGDHWLRVEIRSGDEVLTGHRQLLSCVQGLEALLTLVEPYAQVEPTDTAAATARGLARLLRSMARGGTHETDVPAARHWRELERLVAGEPPLSIDEPGDFRVWLRTPHATVAVRLMVPAKPCANPVPVVVALHGAGGSENLFFDGYGAGKIVRLCRQRGWLLVAPRSGFGGDVQLDAIVASISELIPVDGERVFAVGHSMGAAQLMGYASRRPTSLRGVALLGGGGSTRSIAGLEALPVFLAPGERDFARPNARRLRDALREAGVEKLEYREYEAVEHLGIVQVALDDVFAFFDRL